MTSIKSTARSAGFTLVELMVVIAITAIIMAIAVPTYQNQIRESRRVDAKTAVLDLAGREEKYFSLNNAYTNSSANLGYTAAGTTTAWPIATQSSSTSYYNLYVCPVASTGSQVKTTTCGAAASTTTVGSTYVIAAVPIAGTSQAKDTACQYFAVDNTGTQFASNTASAAGTDYTSTCWH